MPRTRTLTRVHAAVLDLARRGGPGALTMEGIAAEAGVGKQTLYRNWPSVHAILFDALAGDTTTAPSEVDASIEDVLREASREISTEPHCSLLRALAATIQTDPEVARQFHDRLLAPQLDHLRALVAATGVREPHQATEMLLSPVFYRWFMRLPAFTDDELAEHVRRVVGPPS